MNDFLTSFRATLENAAISFAGGIRDILAAFSESFGAEAGYQVTLAVVSFLLIVMALFISWSTSKLRIIRPVARILRDVLLFVFVYFVYLVSKQITGIDPFLNDLTVEFIAALIALVIFDSFILLRNRRRWAIVLIIVMAPSLLILYGSTVIDERGLVDGLRVDLLGTLIIILMTQLWIGGRHSEYHGN